MSRNQCPAIPTTLYDLISALHLHVGAADDRMITAVVAYLLRTGQIRGCQTSPTDRHRARSHLACVPEAEEDCRMSHYH